MRTSFLYKLVTRLLGFMGLVALLTFGWIFLSPRPADPPPEPNMEIRLPDGSSKPLHVVIHRSLRAGPVPDRVRWGWRRGIAPDETDLYALGRWAARKGRVEQAIALLRSVPAEHPRYARAQRYIGWDLYTRTLGRPSKGIPYIHASLRADPLDGNAWEDVSRAYWRAVGGCS